MGSFMSALANSKLSMATNHRATTTNARTTTNDTAIETNSSKAPDETAVVMTARGANIKQTDRTASVELSARDRVFGITELLEEILTHYAEKRVKRSQHGGILKPVHRLVKLQQINKTFRATISSSPRLKRYIRSAAAEVFGIPELLQAILCFNAQEACEHGLTESGVDDDLQCEPMRQLFVWQRVNKTFRNTIQGCKKLRQYMFLEQWEVRSDDKSTRSATLNLETRDLTAFFWLQKVFNDLDEGPYLGRPNGAAVKNGKVVLPNFHIWGHAFDFQIIRKVYRTIDDQRDGRKIWHRRKASWRKIKLFRAPTPGSITVQQPFSTGRFASPGSADEWRHKYIVELSMDNDSTLHDLWKLYADACINDASEHRTNMLRYQGKLGHIKMVVPLRYSFRKKLDDHDRQDLRRRGACFQCREEGHRARDAECVFSKVAGQRFVFGDVEEVMPISEFQGNKLEMSFNY